MSEEKKPTEKPSDVSKLTGLKVKRSRHYRREILAEDSTLLVTNVIHAKIERKDGSTLQVSDTKRKDHKFDPKQRTFFGRNI